jgi:ketosteroid isomerase-like protein
MSGTVSRALVDDFFKVYSTRDPDRLGAFLHDDVVWTIGGPVSVISYCGTHCGKAAVLDLILRVVPSVFRFTNHVQESLLIDGDQVAMLNRRSARRTADGRVISYRVANFMRFKDDKVIANLSLIDSFDAVEQVLGRPLAVHAMPDQEEAGDVVAL